MIVNMSDKPFIDKVIYKTTSNEIRQYSVWKKGMFPAKFVLYN